MQVLGVPHWQLLRIKELMSSIRLDRMLENVGKHDVPREAGVLEERMRRKSAWQGEEAGPMLAVPPANVSTK
jgi:hypothetical protein